MRKMILALVTVGALGTLPAPRPADATVAPSCMDGVIAGCDEDFPPSNYYLIAIRGWCYIIRGAWCLF